MEIAIKQLQNRLLNAGHKRCVLAEQGKADPIPPRGMRAIRLALKCIRRARFVLADRVMKSNEAAAQIWAEALA